MRFVSKVCLVTGGGSGIGQAACERFAAERGRVVVLDINDENGSHTVRAITHSGGEAIFVKADVSLTVDVQAAVKTALAKWGRIDVLVNNAGVMTFVPIVDLEESEWERVMAINLRSLFLFCKFTLPHMTEGGAIVNVSSVHAHETTANVVPYATTKGGIEAFTRGLSRECEPRGVRVNCVDPGAIDTPMLWSNPNVRSGVEKIEGRVGDPADVAAAVAFLASEEARFINGASLAVDGGRLSSL